MCGVDIRMANTRRGCWGELKVVQSTAGGRTLALGEAEWAKSTHHRHLAARDQRRTLVANRHLKLPSRVLLKTWKPVRNVIALEPNGTIALPQKLDYHDIGVVSRDHRKLRFIADDDAIARRKPDGSDVNPTMIGYQIRRL
jgi:hypothetical protein